MFISFTKSVIAVYILAAAILFLGSAGLFPDFYQPKLMASLALVSALIVALPRLVFRPETSREKKIVERMQIIIAVGLIINGIGGLGLYKTSLITIPYDKLAHFVTPFIFTVGLAYFLRDWYRKKIKDAFLYAALIVFVGGFVWEVAEGYSDNFFGTALLGGGTGNIVEDTVLDLAMNVLGVAAGISYLINKNGVAKRKSSR